MADGYFSEQAARWRSLYDAGDDTEEFNELEIRLLGHMPTSASEAATILDILILSLEGGERSDGADVEALKSLKSWLSSPAPELKHVA